MWYLQHEGKVLWHMSIFPILECQSCCLKISIHKHMGNVRKAEKELTLSLSASGAVHFTGSF